MLGNGHGAANDHDRTRSLQEKAVYLGGNLPGLIDPTATAEDDKIIWSSTTVREGLNGSFDYDGLRFSGFQKYGTQFTTNSGDYLP